MDKLETLEKQDIEIPYKVLIFEDNTHIEMRNHIIKKIFACDTPQFGYKKDN